MTAPQAAGVIHSDFEKGFIRAETVSLLENSLIDYHILNVVFKRELDGIQVELQATDPTEMDLEVFKSRTKCGRVGKSIGTNSRIAKNC
ncbi:Actin-binding, cofilin/tropomyosin type [Artemisia annua]|uniref:Actin-binding, cofilin/tropomyosin type n=1 Tax=Artemisia annua TaxID=35608 RepID=A0A2U1PTE8_ARTAN|nr:Actin-binding, cofilin/tropomyosin type [Artemisia annua]